MSSTNGLPRVSVIIPTYNRATYLEGTLRRLFDQTYPADLLEVIVVDNSSTDRTEAMVSEVATEAPFPVRYFRKKNRGPAAARNLGIRNATGDVYAFTDSDCLPEPAWIEAAVSQFSDGVGLVTGPILCWPRQRPFGIFFHTISDVDRENYLYPTANAVYSRAAIERAGLFKERYGTFSWGDARGGEDTELAWRVKRAGYQVQFEPQAIVYHRYIPMKAIQWLRQAHRAQVIPELVAKIPELRTSVLWGRYFLSPFNALFYLVPLGLLLAPLNRRALALTLPWPLTILFMIRGLLWPPKRWPTMLTGMAFLTAYCSLSSALIIKASIRHRTLVL